MARGEGRRDVTVTVSRRAELSKKLAALPKAVKEEIRAALSTSAQEIVAVAKRLVPVDRGDLRDSIGWTFGKAPKGSISLAEANFGDLSVTVFAGNEKAFYARWVEFGTVKMRAHPYFFVSYRAVRKRAKSRISRATTKAAKKVAANG